MGVISGHFVGRGGMRGTMGGPWENTKAEEDVGELFNSGVKGCVGVAAQYAREQAVPEAFDMRET